MSNWPQVESAEELMGFFEANHASIVGITAVSVACFVGSLVALPVVVARAPVDYFVRKHAAQGSMLGKLLRNLAGLVLLAAGVLMLFLPGQGLLAILIGLSLLDFPGKQKLLRKLVLKKSVAKPLQWLRHKTHKPPFELPSSH